MLLLASYSFTHVFRKLGIIFGDGNTNFETFAMEHQCNRFCAFYELPQHFPSPTEKSIHYSEPSHSDDDLPENPFTGLKLKGYPSPSLSQA